MVGTQQLLRRPPSEISISFLGKEITPVSSAKDLGIILDNNLTYDQHIHQLTSSCMTKLCQINRVKNSFDRDTLCTIISALVLSKLFYCSTVWSNTTATNIKKLQTKKSEHITPALREILWLPVNEHFHYRDTVMTFRCQKGLARHTCVSLSEDASLFTIITLETENPQIFPQVRQSQASDVSSISCKYIYLIVISTTYIDKSILKSILILLIRLLLHVSLDSFCISR